MERERLIQRRVAHLRRLISSASGPDGPAERWADEIVNAARVKQGSPLGLDVELEIVLLAVGVSRETLLEAQMLLLQEHPDLAAIVGEVTLKLPSSSALH